eukprot:jgi/Botrbrau1/701/Bobra.160_2s0024.1
MKEDSARFHSANKHVNTANSLWTYSETLTRRLKIVDLLIWEEPGFCLYCVMEVAGQKQPYASPSTRNFRPIPLATDTVLDKRTSACMPRSNCSSNYIPYSLYRAFNIFHILRILQK